MTSDCKMNVFICRKYSRWLVCCFIALIPCMWLYYWNYVRIEPFPELESMPARTGGKFFEGSFEFKCNRRGNHRTIVRYVIPLNPDTGQPLESASNMVFYAPFNGEAPSIRKRGFPEWVRYFPEQAGCSLFTLSIDVKKGENSNSSNYYIYEKGGWYEIFWGIKRHLEKSFQLEERPLLVTGQSSGGSLAEHLVAAYPERIACAAWNGGTAYGPLPDAASQVPMLALHTEGCYGIPSTQRLYSSCLSKNNNLVCGIVPPNEEEKARNLHHEATALAYRLMQLFLTDRLAFEKLWKEHTEIIPLCNEQ